MTAKPIINLKVCHINNAGRVKCNTDPICYSDGHPGNIKLPVSPGGTI